MRTLSGIKRKIRTVTSIQKVTKATAAIANIRFQNLTYALRSAIVYQEAIAASARDISGHLSESDIESISGYFKKGRTGRTILIVLSTDKGLCGTYNSRLLELLAEFSRAQIRLGRKLGFISFGRHATEYLTKMDRNILLARPAVSITGAKQESEEITRYVHSKFFSSETDEIHVLYNRFYSSGLQKAHSFRLLPLDVTLEAFPAKNRGGSEEEGIMGASGTSFSTADFEFDGDAPGFLKSFFYRHLEATLLRTVLESVAGEHAARMNAMQESTSNADELIKDLSMKYNKMRQARITGELIEVVGSAEALN